jgi:hypothetical protein
MACTLKARSLEDITIVKFDYPHSDSRHFKTYLCYYFKLFLYNYFTLLLYMDISSDGRNL